MTDVDGATNYAYDKRDQLVGADRASLGNPDETYKYDANGNRISSSRHMSGYITGPGNRLLSDGTYNYAYDNEGNLSKRTEIATGGYREFTWDYRNRLVAVIDKTAANVATQRVTFRYDGFDRRIGKAVDTTPNDAVDALFSHFVYDREDILMDFVDSDGAGPNAPVLAERYLHGAGVDQVFAQDNAAGSIQWHLTDHLGTVRDLIDNTGAVASHIVYDSFGNIESQTNTSAGSRYLFTGRELDEESGLYYYRARYYDAAVGRFMAPDSFGIRGGDANLFRYVNNRPTDSTDPSGHFGVIGFIIGAGIDLGTSIYQKGLACIGWRDFVSAGVSGVSGALGGGVLFSIGKGAVSGAIKGLLKGESAKETAKSAAKDAFFGGLGPFAEKGVTRIVKNVRNNSRIAKVIAGTDDGLPNFGPDVGGLTSKEIAKRTATSADAAREIGTAAASGRSDGKCGCS